MTINNKIAGLVGLATGIYVSMFGLPGMQSKPVDHVNTPDAAVQQLDQLDSLLTVPSANAGGVPPTDADLEQYLTQPVEDTIGYPDVDYTKVNDDNYDHEVFGSDRPVMVLFYCNEGDASQGLSGLADALDDRFGHQIKFCAYKINDRATVNTPEFRHVTSKYPIEDTPSLIFYDNDNGTQKVMGSEFDWYGGIVKVSSLKSEIDWYSENIQKQILD